MGNEREDRETFVGERHILGHRINRRINIWMSKSRSQRFLGSRLPFLTDKFQIQKDLASVRLGHKSLRTLMKRSSCWYLPGEHFFFDFDSPGTNNLRPQNKVANKSCFQIPSHKQSPM